MIKSKILDTEEPLDFDQLLPVLRDDRSHDGPPVSQSQSESQSARSESEDNEESDQVFEIPQVLKDHHDAEKKELQQKIEIKPSASKSGFAQLVKLFHMRQFIHQILSKRRLISRITKYHLQVINDKASSFDIGGFKKYAINFKPLVQSLQEHTEANSRQSKKEFLMMKTKLFFGKQINFINNLINKIPLMRPDSKFKAFWDACLLICRFYLLFTIPVDLAWPQVQFLFYTLETSTVICIVMLIVDFFVCLFQSFYHEGQLVTDRFLIFKHQITKAYGLEAIANILLIVFYNISNQYDFGFNVFENPYYLFLLLQFVQYKNIIQLKQQLEDALNLSKEASSLVELLKLFLLLFFVIHVFACLWYWVGLYSNLYLDNSWLEAKNILDKSFGDQYLYSFYYSTVTMFTVGYGDITPQTNPEMIVSVIFMSVCSVQLSYSVSTVSAIIEQISGFKEEKKRKFNIINSYMQSKNISYELQFQIREYLNYFWSVKNQQEHNEEKEIIEELSSRLKHRLIFEANSRILYNSPFFSQNFSINFKKDLVDKIVQLTISPENVLDFTKQEDQNVSICFIESGQVQVFIENEQSLSELSTVSTLKQGESFGFFSFITGTPSVEKYKTIGFTKILKLSRKDFLEIIKEYPEDYEIFYSFQEALTFNNELKNLPVKCFSCQATNHRAVACPLLHFQPDKERVIKSAQFNVKQERSKIKERKLKRIKLKATLVQNALQEIAKQASNDNQQLTYLYEEYEEKHEMQSILGSSPKVPLISINMNKSQSDLSDDASCNQHLIIEPKQQEQPKILVPPKKQLLRRKQTLQDLGELSGLHNIKKKSELKGKLQSVVKKVKLMNDFILTEAIDRYALEKESQQLEIKIIQFRLKQIEKIRHLYSNKILSELEFYQYRQQMILKDQIDDNFDISKQFKYFKPKDNLNQVINRTKISMLSSTNEMPKYIESITKKLLNYLFYPQLYIEKYVMKKKPVEYLSETRTRRQQFLKRNNRVSLAFIMQQHQSIKKS